MSDLTVTATQVATVNRADSDIKAFIAGETITAGQSVYLATTGKIGVCDANASGKQQFRGIALNGGGAGQGIDVLMDGECYGFDLSGLNADALVYQSDTAGALATSAGTMTVQAGRVSVLSDSNLTKVLRVRADMIRNWS